MIRVQGTDGASRALGSAVLSPGSSVLVEVPATSANLGPGFDCFGLALDWRERVSLAVIERGYQIEVSGEGAAELPRDESHLIIRSALVGLADLGVTAPGLWLGCRNTIPHGRGLGSSSAAIVAGLVAAAGLAQIQVPSLTGSSGTRMPSRVIPTMWLRRSMEASSWRTRAGPGSGWHRATLTPRSVQRCSFRETSVATDAARDLLPETVPHVDAAANSGRAALLVHALASEPDLLYDATCDWLHQGYREAAMPRSYELMKSLRGQGFAAIDQWCWSERLGAGQAGRSGCASRSTRNWLLATAQWYRISRGDPRALTPQGCVITL